MDDRWFRLGDHGRYPPSKMANQIVERGVESEVLACVSARVAHCFGVLPIATGKHPNTLIVATHRELNSELRINFREITGQQIARQGLAEVGEFFEALNHFYPIAEVNAQYDKWLHPVICVDWTTETLPIDAMYYQVIAYAERYITEITVNELYGAISVDAGRKTAFYSIHMVEMLLVRLKGMHPPSEQFTIQEFEPNQKHLRLIPTSSCGG